MTTEDLPAIGIWLVSIATMVWLAWEPWRRTRHRLSVEIPSRGGTQIVNPIAVFGPAVLAAAGPFLAQLAPHRGINVWLHPHLLMPLGLLELAMLLFVQLAVRAGVLRYAERRRREIAERRTVFEDAC